MEKKRLALVGCGHLGGIVVQAYKAGLLEDYELIGLLGRDPERAAALASPVGCKVCGDLNALLEQKPDYVVEAASVRAVRDYAVPVLESGADLVLLSIGALADAEFRERVTASARSHGAHVHLASGAIGGFDVLKTVSLIAQATGEPLTAGIHTHKGPKSLENTPVYLPELATDTAERTVFTGNAVEAISLLPTKVNVAVAASLATAGPENTQVQITSVPGFVGDDHRIEAKCGGVTAITDIYSATSDIAAWSAVALLRNLCAPIQFHKGGKSMKFKKIVAIEPLNLTDWAEEELHRYADEVVLFRDVPKDNAEIIRRIGGADAALLSYTSRMDRAVIEACPGLRYIGMCCSLYSEESANVDIAAARERGIAVLGIRDYGDRGVVEYVLHELTGLLHGFGRPALGPIPREIFGLKVGMVGLGASGRMIADALQFLGADITYYCRAPKASAEDAGMRYTSLPQLLEDSEVVFTCLNKNVLLLGVEEFRQLGDGKILFNTSIGPGFDSAALERWVRREGNYFFCDTRAAAGPVSPGFFDLPGVCCRDMSAGRTAQAFELLSRKVLDNLAAV